MPSTKLKLIPVQARALIGGEARELLPFPIKRLRLISAHP